MPKAGTKQMVEGAVEKLDLDQPHLKVQAAGLLAECLGVRAVWSQQ